MSRAARARRTASRHAKNDDIADEEEDEEADPQQPAVGTSTRRSTRTRRAATRSSNQSLILSFLKTGNKKASTDDDEETDQDDEQQEPSSDDDVQEENTTNAPKPPRRSKRKRAARSQSRSGTEDEGDDQVSRDTSENDEKDEVAEEQQEERLSESDVPPRKVSARPRRSKRKKRSRPPTPTTTSDDPDSAAEEKSQDDDMDTAEDDREETGEEQSDEGSRETERKAKTDTKPRRSARKKRPRTPTSMTSEGSSDVDEEEQKSQVTDENDSEIKDSAALSRTRRSKRKRSSNPPASTTNEEEPESDVDIAVKDSNKDSSHKEAPSAPHPRKPQSESADDERGSKNSEDFDDQHIDKIDPKSSLKAEKEVSKSDAHPGKEQHEARVTCLADDGEPKPAIKLYDVTPTLSNASNRKQGKRQQEGIVVSAESAQDMSAERSCDKDAGTPSTDTQISPKNELNESPPHDDVVEKAENELASETEREREKSDARPEEGTHASPENEPTQAKYEASEKRLRDEGVSSLMALAGICMAPPPTASACKPEVSAAPSVVSGEEIQQNQPEVDEKEPGEGSTPPPKTEIEASETKATLAPLKKEVDQEESHVAKTKGVEQGEKLEAAQASQGLKDANIIGGIVPDADRGTKQTGENRQDVTGVGDSLVKGAVEAKRPEEDTPLETGNVTAKKVEALASGEEKVSEGQAEELDNADAVMLDDSKEQKKGDNAPEEKAKAQDSVGGNSQPAISSAPALLEIVESAVNGGIQADTKGASETRAEPEIVEVTSDKDKTTRSLSTPNGGKECESKLVAKQEVVVSIPESVESQTSSKPEIGDPFEPGEKKQAESDEAAKRTLEQEGETDLHPTQAKKDVGGGVVTDGSDTVARTSTKETDEAGVHPDAEQDQGVTVLDGGAQKESSELEPARMESAQVNRDSIEDQNAVAATDVKAEEDAGQVSSRDIDKSVDLKRKAERKPQHVPSFSPQFLRMQASLPDLEQLKMRLYLAGASVHRGRGAERRFASYWNALAQCVSLRLNGSDSNGRTFLGEGRDVLDSFLTTPKLRKLHNKLILATMKRCLQEFVPDSDVQRHIPGRWRGRTKRHRIDQKVGEPLAVSVSPEQEAESWASDFDANSDVWSAGGMSDRAAYGIRAALASTREEPNTAFLSAVTNESGISSCLPGALTIDRLLKGACQSHGIGVASNAVWLLVIAVREYASSILRNTISNVDAVGINQALPPRVLPPSVFNSTKGSSKKSNSRSKTAAKLKEEVVRSGGPPEATPQPESHRTKKRRFITSFDISGFLGSMPLSIGASLGGSTSRLAYERCMASSFVPGIRSSEFDSVNDFLSSEITGTAPKRQKSDHEALASALFDGIDSVPTSLETTVSSNNVPAIPGADPLVRRSSGGLGRGAKNLAALRARAVAAPASKETEDGNATIPDPVGGQAPNDSSRFPSSRPPAVPPGVGAAISMPVAEQAAAPPGVQPPNATPLESQTDNGNENRADSSAARIGRGFGVKNLAAIRARSSTTGDSEGTKPAGGTNDLNPVSSEQSGAAQTTGTTGSGTALPTDASKETELSTAARGLGGKQLNVLRIAEERRKTDGQDDQVPFVNGPTLPVTQPSSVDEPKEKSTGVLLAPALPVQGSSDGAS